MSFAPRILTRAPLATVSRAATSAIEASSRSVAVAAAALILSVYLLLPFLWLLRTTFLTQADVLAVPPRWFPEGTLDNYLLYVDPSGEQALRAGNAARILPRSLLNSGLIAFMVVALNLAVGVPAAYGFARFRFRGSASLLLLYLATRMLPPVALMIPIYVFFANVQLLDTLLAPAIAHVALTLPFTVWILKSYFQTIPQELEDAARVDRCSRLQAVVRVLLPVATPGLLAAAMFAFMTSWGEFLLASTLTRSIDSMPATIVIAILATDPDVSMTVVSTGAVLSIVIPVVLALAFQRVIVQGLVSGAVKG